MEQLIIEGIDLTEFLGIPYVGSRHPGNVSPDEFLANPQLGANCQLFALGVLRRFGFCIDDRLPMDQGERLGSQELWLDDVWTKKVAVVEGEASRPMNLFFFWPKDVHASNFPCDFKKLHVGVCVGSLEGSHSHCVLHNAKPGPSAVWRLADFYESGYRPYGIKRPIRRISS